MTTAIDWDLYGVYDRVVGHQGGLHVERAYKREVYLRPPRELIRKKGVICKLLKSPYGLVDAVRQCSMKIEGWIHVERKLENVFVEPQLFIESTGPRIDLLCCESNGQLPRGCMEKNNQRINARSAVAV